LLTVFAPSKTLWQAQALLVLIYTVVISIYLPEFWLHPFGPILKNIPFLTLLWLLYKHEGITQ
jgi:DoxX-like family